MIDLIGMAVIVLLGIEIIVLFSISAKLRKVIRISEDESKQTQSMQTQVVTQLRKVDSGTNNVQQEFVRSNKMLYDIYISLRKNTSGAPPEI